MGNERFIRVAGGVLGAGVLAMGLSACGGGGGGEAAQPTLVITSANSDTVGHVTAAGMLALAMPLRSPGMLTLAANRANALLQRARIQSAANGSRSPLSQLTTGDVPCNFGGTLSLTIDDLDESGTESAGDVETLVYTNCMGTETETVNGTVTLTVLQADDTSVSYRADLSQFSDTTASHAVSIQGSYLVDLSSPSASVINARMTAYGPVTVAVSTHLPFTDTVTLRSGFVVQDSFDESVAAPAGGTVAGQSVSTVEGMLESALAGGSFGVATQSGAPWVKYAAEDYPHAGVVKVKGKTGGLVLTALSSDSVRLDLDANDDGAVESSAIQTWEWLL